MVVGINFVPTREIFKEMTYGVLEQEEPTVFKKIAPLTFTITVSPKNKITARVWWFTKVESTEQSFSFPPTSEGFDLACQWIDKHRETYLERLAKGETV